MPNQTSTIPDCETLLQSRLQDIMTMVEYASNEGIAISDEVGGSIGRISCIKPPNAEDGSGYSAQGRADLLSLSLAVHSSLCRLVAPATPVTIRCSDPSRSWHKINPVISGLMSAGIFSILVIVGCFILSWCIQKTIVLSDGYMILIILAAAGLGSAFEGLWRANKYIKERTFDPRYNQTYWIRLVLGIIAGVILGIFGKDLPIFKEGTKAVAPCLLALIGGYSSEAVALILQRVSDTLVTSVRGSNEDSIKAKVDEALSASSSELHKAKAEAIRQGGSQEAVVAAIQAAIDRLTRQNRK